MDKTFRNSPAVPNRAAFLVTSNSSLILTFSRVFLKHIGYKRLSLIVRVNVVLNRTVVVDSD